MYAIGSILEKDTKKRRPFVIVGDFKGNRNEMLDALKEALICPEDYDFRTLKYYEDGTGPTIVAMHLIDDELDIS